jgi:hypothetical protein
MTPDDILRDHNPEVQAIAETLRHLIHDTIDNMTERAYPGWHAIGFRHPRAGISPDYQVVDIIIV